MSQPASAGRSPVRMVRLVLTMCVLGVAALIQLGRFASSLDDDHRRLVLGGSLSSAVRGRAVIVSSRVLDGVLWCGGVMRRRIALLVAVVVVSLGASTGVADAAVTTVTFTVSGGALTVSAPASASLGTGAGGGTVSATLGTVTVSDQRGNLAATWTASVSSTSFTTGGGSAAETIAASDASYCSGAATATTGTGVFTPGQLSCPTAAVSLGSSRTAFSLTGGAGTNSASWNPTVLVAVPATVVAGAYTGTVTQSVA